MGQIIGGTLAIALIAALVEWAVIKRVMDDPTMGGPMSVAIAYILAIVLYGFGAANGRGWQPIGILVYLPGAIIAGIWFWHRGVKASEAAGD